jgi:hypothetical protein
MCETERIMHQMELNKKIRRTWEINPKTRIKESKKGYNRKVDKTQIRKLIKNIQEWID